MSYVLVWLNTFTRETAMLLLLDTVVKATVLLLVACLAAAVLRRASAAVRHRMWCLSFGGLLLLPVLSSLLPGWQVPILPEPAESGAVLVAHVNSARATDPAIDAQAIPLADRAAGGTAVPLDGRSWDSSVDSALAEKPTTMAAVPAIEASSSISREVLMGVGWLLGLCVAVLPVVIGLIRNHFLGRGAQPVVDTERKRLQSELCCSLGASREVRLLESHKSLVPMTWGVLRPIVLLPFTWRDWSRERQRLVLLHELAHVKRYDVAFQLLARLACAMYWFHPLAWYALRRLRIERETACDDCVLMAGERPSDYAQQLVEIVRSCCIPVMSAAVAMAQSTKLERRVRAVLDRARSHLPLGRNTGRALMVCAALVVTGVATVRPAARSEAKEAAVTEVAESTRAARSEDEPASATQAANGSSNDDDIRLEYRGQVVDPEGKPVAGARVFLVYWLHGAPLDYVAKPRAVTDDKGRFEFSTTRSDFEPDAKDAWRACSIVAAADGYGFAAGFSVAFETTGKARDMLRPESLAYLKERLNSSDGVLRLVPDDMPISGRIATSDGEPVAGARVRVDRIWFNDEGDLAPWEKAAKEEKADFYSLRRQAPHCMNGPHVRFIIPDVTTDEKGGFTLQGVGRERVVQLLISGPGIETNQIKARTRKGDKVIVPHQWKTRHRSKSQETYFAAEFVYVPGPSKPVSGRVTDADTGKPISGALVSAGQMGSFFRSGSPYIADVTEADGRYRLEGLPIGKENRINVFPTADTAYLPAGMPVDTQIDEPSATQDFQLRQGVWVRGRAIDDRTGKPVPGRIQYFAFRDNPHLESFPRFSRTFIHHERRTDEDGRFEIAVLPGSGIITFMAIDHTRYRRGLGAETITGPTQDVRGTSKMFTTVPTLCISENHHALRQIGPEGDSEPIELILTLTSGVDLTGRLLDPDGKPLTGGVVFGNIQHAWYPIQGEEFRIEGYYPDRPRDLFFHHPERNLAGYFRLEGEPPEQLTITLQPAGSIHGRLVDDSGKPMSGMSLTGEGVPGENYGNAALRLGTDQNGRFHIRGLIPGRKYTVDGRGNRKYGRVLIDVTGEAGQTKDVGDVTLQRPPPRVRPSP